MRESWAIGAKSLITLHRLLNIMTIIGASHHLIGHHLIRMNARARDPTPTPILEGLDPTPPPKIARFAGVSMLPLAQVFSCSSRKNIGHYYPSRLGW